ncbi:MAG TPA: cytochrome c biogenesis protein CcdA, partial [Mucilaginibacter sp.]
MKTAFYAFIATIILSIACLSPAQAFQKQADTVSSSDVQFTDIPANAPPVKKKADTTPAKNKTGKPLSANAKSTGLWQIFLIGLGWGFTAFLMPCIYPLLPLTVSFFLKLGGSRAKAVGFALFYMLSIIVIYVSLGMVLSILFGPDTLNNIATNGVFNIIIFLLLIVFGISFLGAFEITLPSSLVNKVDTLSDKGGIIGIF